MFAVVRTGGKQYRVEEGRSLRIERLAGEPGDTVEIGEVLLMGDGGDVTFGTPTVAGARVLGRIEEQGRAQKVVVFRYKAKTRSRKKTGHRQPFTRVVIEDILAAGQEPKPKKAAAPAPEEAPAEAPKARRRRTAKPQPAPEAAAAPVAASEADTPATEPDTGAEAAPAAKPRRTRKKAE
ncbi:MAG TPA: 50S ribosomal protein L21 [Dehalococcoidia bacterium]|nr:50S ribosomal protein L21 [Dehalococcoidia bacterium]